MKLQTPVYYVLGIIILFFSSCAPVYIPNTSNTPLLTNKKEVQASIHAGTSGFDPQFAYAVTDHMGIMLNGSFLNSTSDSTDSYHKHKFVEAGAGYYSHFGTRGKFETFAGAGFGKIDALYWLSDSNVSFTRYFIQPSVGITTKVVDAGLSTRIVIVNYNQISTSVPGVFFEPIFTLKAGYDHIKAVGKIGFSFPMNSEKTNFDNQPFILSLGIQANFGKIFR